MLHVGEQFDRLGIGGNDNEVVGALHKGTIPIILPKEIAGRWFLWFYITSLKLM